MTGRCVGIFLTISLSEITYVAWFIDSAVSRWVILYEHVEGAWQSIFVAASNKNFQRGTFGRYVAEYFCSSI
jgi:hypothetical protein